VLIQLQRPGRRRRGPVRLDVLSQGSRDAVASALGQGADQLATSVPRLVVFDGRTRHVLDAGAPDLGVVRDELLSMPSTHTLSACEALAVLAELIVASDPSVEADSFVERLGEQAAGVRPGVLGIADLATGGKDHLRGTGFRDELDDGTGGQARHFAGVAATAVRFGGNLTGTAARHLLGDDPSSADAHLTEKALELVRLLGSRELTPDGAAGWIRREVCEPVGDPGGTP
jgi:hypothetical protein